MSHSHSLILGGPLDGKDVPGHVETLTLLGDFEGWCPELIMSLGHNYLKEVSLVSSDTLRDVRNLGTPRVVIEGNVVISGVSATVLFRLTRVKKRGLSGPEDEGRLTGVEKDLGRPHVSRQKGILCGPTI